MRSPAKLSANEPFFFFFFTGGLELLSEVSTNLREARRARHNATLSHARSEVTPEVMFSCVPVYSHPAANRKLLCITHSIANASAHPFPGAPACTPNCLHAQLPHLSMPALASIITALMATTVPTR